MTDINEPKPAAIDRFEETEPESSAVESHKQPVAKRWPLSRNKLIAIGASVLLLGSGGAWAYGAYQAPSTVIGMAIGSLFGQQNQAFDLNVTGSGAGLSGGTGSLKIKVSSADVGADVSAAIDFKLLGQTFGANVEAITSKTGDVYVQLSKFDSLLVLAAGTGLLPQEATAKLNSAVDAKWFKLSKAEIDQLAGNAGSASTCLQEKYKNTAHAEAVRTEITNLAKVHQFIVVTKELGNQRGSLGYEMGVDVPQLKQFLIGYLGTASFADLSDCQALSIAGFDKAQAVKAINSLKASDVKTAFAGATIDIWADQWSHKLTKLSLDYQRPGIDLKVELMPAGDRSSSVKIPSESTSFAELQAALTGSSSHS